MKNLYPFNLAREIFEDDQMAMNILVSVFVNLIEKALSANEKKVIALRFEKQFTIKEISNELKIPQENVRFILTRSIVKLGDAKRVNSYIGIPKADLIKKSSELQEIQQMLEKQKLEKQKLENKIKEEMTSKRTIDPRKERLGDILQKPLAFLELSVRPVKALSSKGVWSVGELIELSEGELMSVRNMGIGSVQEVKSALKSYGLSLRKGRIS